MKLVQKNWRAMPESEKDFYKEQSRINRVEYDERKKQFDEHKSKDPNSSKLNVIEGIQMRRV